MAQSLSNVLVHVVFSTKDRRPFLKNGQTRIELHSYLAGVSTKLDCPVLKIGGVADHVHLLGKLSRTIPISEWVKELKRASSRWIKTNAPEMSAFQWQGGYGSFSIGQSQAIQTIEYIANQEEHHRKVDFKDELRQLLQRYQIEYDERFLWD
ncbi:MAG: IS200/IS605 family transposase [Verrucomicrobia bacterium]|nr:IS200/IS605 family transposase [Verrucomicrobiota bacterium]